MSSREEFDVWFEENKHYLLDELRVGIEKARWIWIRSRQPLQEDLDAANANYENLVAHMQSVCAERDRLARWGAKLEKAFRWHDKCHWGVRKPKWLIAIQEKLEAEEKQV